MRQRRRERNLYDKVASIANAVVLMIVASTNDTVIWNMECNMEHANWSVSWMSRAG